MKIYAKYVKTRERAMSVFTTALNELKHLHTSLMSEHEDCSLQIKKHVEQQRFIEGEATLVHNHIQAITRVIGDEVQP